LAGRATGAYGESREGVTGLGKLAVGGVKGAVRALRLNIPTSLPTMKLAGASGGTHVEDNKLDNLATERREGNQRPPI
jgi:hypothetical protein